MSRAGAEARAEQLSMVGNLCCQIACFFHHAGYPWNRPSLSWVSRSWGISCLYLQPCWVKAQVPSWIHLWQWICHPTVCLGQRAPGTAVGYPCIWLIPMAPAWRWTSWAEAAATGVGLQAPGVGVSYLAESLEERTQLVLVEVAGTSRAHSPLDLSRSKAWYA